MSQKQPSESSIENRVELAQESEYERCCVPLEGLLEVLGNHVERERLIIDSGINFLGFILLMALGVWSFQIHQQYLGFLAGEQTSQSNFIFLSEALVPYVTTSETTITTSTARRLETDQSLFDEYEVFGLERRNLASYTQVCPNVYLIDNKQIREQVTNAGRGLKDRQALQSLTNILLFLSCQPDDTSGQCYSRVLSGQSSGSTTYGLINGVRYPSDTESCFKVPLTAEQVGDTNASCFTVNLENSNSECFPGFESGVAVVPNIQQCFENLVSNLQSEGRAIANSDMDLCPPLMYGFPGEYHNCEFKRSGANNWNSYIFSNFSDWQQRVTDTEFITNRSSYSSDTCLYETNNTWLSQNTRDVSVFITKYNGQSQMASFSFQSEALLLLGPKITNRWTYAIVPQSNSQDIAMLVSALAVLLFVVFMTFIEPFVAFYRERTGWWPALVQYVRGLSAFSLLDVILVAALIAFVVEVSLFHKNVSFVSLDTGQTPIYPCKSYSVLRYQETKQQLLGLILFLQVLRILKFLRIRTFVAYTWGGMAKGFYYFLPSLIVFTMTTLIYSVVLFMTKARLDSFSSFYNCLCFLMSMVVSPTLTWKNIAFNEILASHAFTMTDSVGALVFSYLYVLFIQIPFYSLAIGAFFYGVLFTEASATKKEAQKRVDNQIRMMQNLVQQVTSAHEHGMLTAKSNELYTEILFNTDPVSDRKIGCFEKASFFYQNSRQKIRSWCSRCLKKAKLKAKRISGSEDEIDPKLLWLPSNRQALIRLTTYSMSPENRLSDFISFDQIKRVTGAHSRARVVSLMNLVGVGNIYDQSLMQQYQNDKLHTLFTGEHVFRRMTMDEIARKEKRRSAVDVTDVFQRQLYTTFELSASLDSIDEVHEYAMYCIKGTLIRMRHGQQGVQKLVDEFDQLLK